METDLTKYGLDIQSTRTNLEFYAWNYSYNGRKSEDLRNMQHCLLRLKQLSNEKRYKDKYNG